MVKVTQLLMNSQSSPLDKQKVLGPQGEFAESFQVRGTWNLLDSCALNGSKWDSDQGQSEMIFYVFS
jgi:hypothetical protein